MWGTGLRLPSKGEDLATPTLRGGVLASDRGSKGFGSWFGEIWFLMFLVSFSTSYWIRCEYDVPGNTSRPLDTRLVARVFPLSIGVVFTSFHLQGDAGSEVPFPG